MQSHSNQCSFPLLLAKPLVFTSSPNTRSEDQCMMPCCSSLGLHPSHKTKVVVINQWISTGPILVKKSIVRPWRTNKFNQNLNSLSETARNFCCLTISWIVYLLLGIRAAQRKFLLEKSVHWIIWRISFLRLDSPMYSSSSPLHERERLENTMLSDSYFFRDSLLVRCRSDKLSYTSACETSAEDWKSVAAVQLPAPISLSLQLSPN